jgi:glycosyltransferase involved in cell wall biosynthesis
MSQPRAPRLDRVSVVIPAYNCADLLDRALAALDAQSYDGEWEVVVGDNGSRDHTPEVVTRWHQRGLAVRLVDASARRGPAAARNIAGEAAVGDALLFTDADDEVAAGWLAAMESALQDADVVAGALDFRSLNGLGQAVAKNPWPLQFRYLPAGLGANLAIRTGPFRALGGFDEALTVGEDIDLCWRLQHEGRRFGYAEPALVHKRERESPAHQRRQSFAYGRGDPLLYRRHREHGMPRALGLTIKTWLWLLANVVTIASTRRRTVWSRVLFLRLGRLAGSVEQRVFYP